MLSRLSSLVRPACFAQVPSLQRWSISKTPSDLEKKITDISTQLRQIDKDISFLKSHEKERSRKEYEIKNIKSCLLAMAIGGAGGGLLIGSLSYYNKYYKKQG